MMTPQSTLTLACTGQQEQGEPRRDQWRGERAHGHQWCWKLGQPDIRLLLVVTFLKQTPPDFEIVYFVHLSYSHRGSHELSVRCKSRPSDGWMYIFSCP